MPAAVAVVVRQRWYDPPPCLCWRPAAAVAVVAETTNSPQVLVELEVDPPAWQEALV
jgi:hypothetical protein